MWNNPRELFVAGGGQVYVAPVGTPLPAGPNSALNAAFNGLGYHTEDGASISVAPEIVEHKAWQSRHPVRRDLVGYEVMANFALEQWNEITVPLAFGGGDISAVSGGFKYSPPVSSDALDERAMIIDCDDGDRRTRFVIPRGTVAESVESQFQSTELAVLPITFKALEPDDGSLAWYPLFSDSDAFAAGS